MGGDLPPLTHSAWDPSAACGPSGLEHEDGPAGRSVCPGREQASRGDPKDGVGV